MPVDTVTAARRLDTEISQVERDLSTVRADLAEERSGPQELSRVDQHPADTGTETFDLERDRSLAEGFEQRLEELRRARARIDDGRYGLCERCGQPIDDERLEALPAARFCLADELVVERESRL